MSKESPNRVSYSLEPDYQQLLKEIARALRSNQTAVMRRMIDEAASKLGMEPIAPVFLSPPSKEKARVN